MTLEFKRWNLYESLYYLYTIFIMTNDLLNWPMAFLKITKTRADVVPLRFSLPVVVPAQASYGLSKTPQWPPNTSGKMMRT